MIWMSQDGEPPKNDADSENDRKPDQPHGNPVEGWLAGSLADQSCPKDLTAWVEHALLDHRAARTRW